MNGWLLAKVPMGMNGLQEVWFEIVDVDDEFFDYLVVHWLVRQGGRMDCQSNVRSIDANEAIYTPPMQVVPPIHEEHPPSRKPHRQTVRFWDSAEIRFIPSWNAFN